MVQAVSADDTPPARRAPGSSLGAAQANGQCSVCCGTSPTGSRRRGTRRAAPGAPDGTRRLGGRPERDPRTQRLPVRSRQQVQEYPEPTRSVAKAFPTLHRPAAVGDARRAAHAALAPSLTVRRPPRGARGPVIPL
ncbi:hypothetical protein QJS66_08220 [Kocuria rhizophila]|nr:hypothetical protein QJS66_08220 [Kocuria rhizophila]